MPFERDLTEIINDSQDALLESIRKVAVGFITAVNGQRVDVQLSVSTPLFSAIDGTVFEPPHVLGDVPLCALRGGGFMVWVPVKVGDPVLVLFTDISADNWRNSDGKTVTQPGWVGRHTADSAFAMPMIAPDTTPLTSADAGKLVIGKDGGSALIKIGDSIELGASATDAVAVAGLVKAELDKIVTAFGGLIAPSGGGPVTSAPLTAYTASPVASALVKLQP
jgi:hypothetical protein